MGIFQLTGDLDSPFTGLDKQVLKSGALAKMLEALRESDVTGQAVVPQLLKVPTVSFVGMYLEIEPKWYAFDEDLGLVGRYEKEVEAQESGGVFVKRTPFNDFFALYNSMNAVEEFQKIEDIFLDAVRDHVQLFEALGSDLDFFADLAVYGQVSVESGWEDDARGLWQISDLMSTDLVECYDEYINKSDINKKDFAASTTAVVDYYARMYSWFGGKCETIADYYGLNPRDFLVPCLIDAYHCSPAKMNGILDLFIEMVQEGLFEDLEGQEVYNQMSRMYFEDGEDGGYGADERYYFYRVQAIAGLMTLQMSGYDVSQFREDLSIE
jgi:hypothetical protein